MKKIFSLLAALLMAATWASAKDKTPLAEITIGGVTTQYTNTDDLGGAIFATTEGEISVKLLADCDFGNNGQNNLPLLTTTTFDLNGYTLTGRLAVSHSVTINDSSEGKTGKVKVHPSQSAVTVAAPLTINGGTFEGMHAVEVYHSTTVTLNGGTFISNADDAVFAFNEGGKIIIREGYEFTDDNGHSVSGTITNASDQVKFAGSVVMKSFAEITLDGVKTKYTDVEAFHSAVIGTRKGEMSIKLLADCDLGNDGKTCLYIHTTTTFDLNGHTLKAYLFILEPTTINDSSEGKTGKVQTASDCCVMQCYDNTTINGGTFDGGEAVHVGSGATVTINGGSFSADSKEGAFGFDADSDANKIVIADGYEYTDGNGHAVSGTINRESAKVKFAGSIKKGPFAEITKNGVTTRYTSQADFLTALFTSAGCKISVKLLTDCDMDNGGLTALVMAGTTTFDLNGHTLKGWLYISAPTTIIDSSAGKTGKIIAPSGYHPLSMYANTTINGGTFEGYCFYVDEAATVTLNGGTYSNVDDTYGTFDIANGGKVVIADGYELTDGEGNSVSGTVKASSDAVKFAGSVVRIPFAEITLDGETTKYNDEERFIGAVGLTQSGEMSIRLLTDCDLENNDENGLFFYTTTTLDLAGHKLTGWLYVEAPTTINDSSAGKTGKVVIKGDYSVVEVHSDLTINGGMFEGPYSLDLAEGATATLNGGSYRADDSRGAFRIDEGGKVVIAAGYEYTDGNGHAVRGTLTSESAKVKFDGSIEKALLAEMTLNGTAAKIYDVEFLVNAVLNTTGGDMSIKLMDDCNLGDGGQNSLSFQTTTTFDLNGYTLTGWLEIQAPTTINDSSKGKTGKVAGRNDNSVLDIYANTTINGGTFEGGYSLYVQGEGVTATLNGGTYNAFDEHGAFSIMAGSKVVIADGYEFTDGNDNAVSGTLDSESEYVMFAGSVVKTSLAEITLDGVTTKYTDVTTLRTVVNAITYGEMTVRLLADCDLGNDGENDLHFQTASTFDLNGHTLTGWLYISAMTTINDSSEGQTGKVKAASSATAVDIYATTTINGGTFEGRSSLNVCRATTVVTLNGGTYCTGATEGAFTINNGKIVIPEGYEYTDGQDNAVSGTLTSASAKVMFAGSIMEKQTPTAVDNIDAQKAQKTIKTIENGEIVIIRGGERFNLRGAKIK